MSRAVELGALAFAAVSGCAALAPSPVGSSAGEANRAAVAGSVPERPAGELDAASALALGGLPRQLGRFSLDAYAGVRAFGLGAPLTLERACDTILGPSCNDDGGLEHVLALRYVDGTAGRAALDVIVSRYADADAAFARFTEDLIGDRDPLELTARPLDVPGLGVLDGERAASWLGRYVVHLSRVDETMARDERLAAAAADLPEAARRLLGALPAEAELPAAVRALPRDQRIPLGVRLFTGDALGVTGMGSGAIGYYREGEKRWRVLSIVRPDAESAKDVLSTLGRSPAAHPIQNAPLDAFAFTERRLPAEPYVGWVVGQRHEVIYGIGDEATALPEFTPLEREASVKLSLLDKLAKLTKVHLP